MDWMIREVGDSDLIEMAALVSRCLDTSWSRAALAETRASSMSRMRIASSQTGRVGAEGFLIARRILDSVEIDLLGVAPEARRRGCAAALLSDLIDREAAAGAEELRLELRESNRSAHALYTGLGFVVVGSRSRYYPDGEDATLLTRRLEERDSPPSSTEL